MKKVYIPLNNFGVMACCRLGAGSAFSKALKRERAAGSRWAEPLMCMGLGSRWFQNAVAKWYVALRTVPTTIELVHLPAISLLPFSHWVVQRQVMKE